MSNDSTRTIAFLPDDRTWEYPVVCGNLSAHWRIDDDGVHDRAPYEQGNSNRLYRLGWRITNDTRFSVSGEWVWACPECVKQYDMGTSES